MSARTRRIPVIVIREYDYYNNNNINNIVFTSCERIWYPDYIVAAAY